ncbi:MAG: SpoIIE family protein phosphatase [Treponema sp.]|nr:SpoIIE family protein phosphatase [Treponema sp.]
MTTTIDSFVSLPLLISAGVAALVIIFLLLIKLRKKARISYIFFVVAAIIIVGSLYCYYTEYYIYYVFAIILAQAIVLPYLIVKLFDNPQKREEKKAAKKAAEIAASRDADMVSKQVVAEIEEKHQRLLDVNKDLISKLSSFFSSDNSMENYLEYCNDLIAQRISADGCVILMADDYDNTLAVKSFKGSFPPPYKLPDDLPHKPIRVETNLRFAQFQLEGNIFGEIFSSAEPAFIPDSVRDPRVYQNGPEEFLRCGGYLFAPIKQPEGVVGLIALSRLPDKEKFTKQDFDTLVILADAISTTMKPLYSFLAYAEHTELNKGGSIASKYQKDLLPAKLPVIPGITIGCFTNPMENVCGDYYDIIVSRKDRISFIMTDVAGKGMNSLIVMIMIRAILRLAVNTAQSASTIMSWANRGICIETSKIDHFASVALINYDATNKEVDISTCGNNPVFIYKAADKTIKQISEPTEPMGVAKETEYKNQVFKLESGDIVATCTDGLIESLNENGVQYSVENLKKAIVKNCNANAKDITNRVKDDLRKYCSTAQQYDDQSLLVIKIQ